MESIPENFTSSMWSTMFRAFPLKIDPTETLLRHWLQMRPPRCGSQSIISSKCTKPRPFSRLYSMLGAHSLHSMLIRTPAGKHRTGESYGLKVYIRAAWGEGRKENGITSNCMLSTYIFRALFYTQHVTTSIMHCLETLSSSPLLYKQTQI
jgi:hypothetical protein